MKTTSKFTHALIIYCIAFALMTFGCNPENKPPQETPAETQSGSGANQPRGFFPFLASKYHYVKAASARTYGIKIGDDKFVIPNMITPLIKTTELQRYYNAHSQNNHLNGLLFYPAYKDNTLMLMMCLARYDVATRTITGNTAYVTLENGHYLVENSIVPDVTSIGDSTHIKLLKAYIENVQIKQKPQVPTGQETDTIRISRFYLWNDFRKLIEQNNGQNNYLQFDIGYVDLEIAENYLGWLLNGFTVNQQRGFTALFHVKDENGKPLLDPLDEYKPDSPTDRENYRNRGLEVGVPCPPRCGLLNYTH